MSERPRKQKPIKNVKADSNALQNPVKTSFLKVLPINSEILSTEKSFGTWLYQHSPFLMKELFDTLPDVHPAERCRILHELLKTSLAFRPSVDEKIEATGIDAVLKEFDLLDFDDEDKNIE